MDFGKVMFSPNGRIGQQDYWIGVLIIIGGNIIGGFIPILGFFISLVLIWCGIAVYGKRLHDAGKSAWLHVIPWALGILLGVIGFVMILGAGLGAAMSADGGELEPDQILALIAGGGTGILVMSSSFLVWIIYTIWVGVMKGEPEANAHGPVPGSEPTPAPAASAGEGPDQG